jgi:hypothetical protein
VDYRRKRQPKPNKYRPQVERRGNQIQMKNPITEARYNEILSWSEDKELTSFWSYLEQDFPEFNARRDAFFWVLRRALMDKKIVLINMQSHAPLSGSIDELLNLFRASFPKDITEMNRGMWFFSEFCPGGSAWQHSGS